MPQFPAVSSDMIQLNQESVGAIAMLEARETSTADTPGIDAEKNWLLLIHQIPPKPNYFRVKIWRRLQRLGAVALKNSVYVLPRSDQAHEDLRWVLREIVAGGGDATLCEAHFVEGIADEQVMAMFHAARDGDYQQVAEAAGDLLAGLEQTKKIPDEERLQIETELAKLRRKVAEIGTIDFFGAPGREAAQDAIVGLEGCLQVLDARPGGAAGPALQPGELKNRVWVTRVGIQVDRIASAWLIRRFIDPQAKFKYVQAKGYKPATGELRFDMFEAEFTHEGDDCTFEVLLRRVGLKDEGLKPIAELIHDIDLKDGKFGRPEAAGLDMMLTGITQAHKDDKERLARGSALFDDLYEYFRKSK